MKPMATATSFVPVRRWMLSPSRSSGGDVPWKAAAGRRVQEYALVQIAAGGLLLALLVAMPLWASTESAAIAEIHPEDRPIDIVSGITYRAGARLQIPGTDWSFVVPDNWQSNRPDDADMPFLTPEEGKELGMIFPLAEVTREAVREQLGQPLSLLHGLSFVPAGLGVETEASIAQSYQGEEMAGRALAVIGPGTTAVIYFLMGPPQEASAFHSILEQLGQSTRFGDPGSGRDVGL